MKKTSLQRISPPRSPDIGPAHSSCTASVASLTGRSTETSASTSNRSSRPATSAPGLKPVLSVTPTPPGRRSPSGRCGTSTALRRAWALRGQGNWRWEGPLGTPLGLVHWKRASSPVEARSEEHTSELQSPLNLVCRLLLEKKKKMGEVGVDGGGRGRGMRPYVSLRGR